MIPIDDRYRQLLIEAIDSERSQIQIEADMPQADRMNTNAELCAELIAAYTVMHDALLDNRWVIFDTRPRCMVVDKKEGQCTGEGKYAPFIVVYDALNQPICQAETNPPLRVCEGHATSNVDDYMPPEAWKRISAEALRLRGSIVLRDNARVMFLDIDSGQMVPPPTVKIIGGNNG